jgi:dihydroorotate dehydrogenase (NAD+) catalytic subunit
MRRVAKSGAGAVVTKSIGLEPRLGYPNPTIVDLGPGMLNAVGLPNPGIGNYQEEMAVALEGGVPVIGSIFAGDGEGMAKLAAAMEAYGAHAIELNLSCPHVKTVGTEIGTVPELVSEIVEAVKASTRIPVFAKLSPNVPEIADLARVAEDSGADGITAVNTVKAMAIVPELRRPLLGNKVGGLSGPPLKPLGLRAVYEIYGAVDIPIMGCGGITTGMDAVEYIMAGATVVQIGTGIRFRGLGIFKEVCSEMSAFMEAEGFNSIKEMVGVAHS